NIGRRFSVGGKVVLLIINIDQCFYGLLSNRHISKVRIKYPKTHQKAPIGNYWWVFYFVVFGF
ncbi:hypothetical protein KKE33_01725, partial [Patescibacteria group bacterium]|nr:hypothetical protein [Patescibacteria group bacterium]